MTKEIFETKIMEILQLNSPFKTKINLIKRLLSELDRGGKH
jgi:hypothetical protein